MIILSEKTKIINMPHNTIQSIACGTPGYVAPEVLAQVP